MRGSYHEGDAKHMRGKRRRLGSATVIESPCMAVGRQIPPPAGIFR